MKQAASALALVIASVVISLLSAEFVLRVKNSSMKSYDIEMWRYAKELKRRSDDPDLGFDHVRSKSALLQSVDVRLNELGLRGGPLRPPTPGERRILFLGGSIALGWGVAEKETVEARLETMLRGAGVKASVLNAGVGNYNAVRYVTRFFKELTEIDPTDIVVLFFLRDAEDLPPDSGNFALRTSELAVTLWIAYHRLLDRSGEAALVDHYRQAYRPDAPGFVRMKEKLKELAGFARARKINCFLAMMPDIHNVVDYRLGFVHDLMRGVAAEYGYEYVDLLSAFAGRKPQDLFAMPGDPHPNALGHQLMAEAIFPVISQDAKGGETSR